MGDYQTELANLSSLNLLNHRNIVHLLGSYTHRNKHNFIFPQAQAGNLSEMFKQGRPTEFREDQALIFALSGLASAVSEVHNFVVNELDLVKIGCHHDLKPDNILVDGNQFVLTDFGLTRFKEGGESSSSLFKNGRGYCLAPECQDLEDDFERYPIHRSSDIWSFGCVIADLVTYMLKGPAGVIQFKQRRRWQVGKFIYYYFHYGSSPNTGVKDWFSELQKLSPRPITMLIELSSHMLDMRPEIRPSASEVVDRLRSILLCMISSQVHQDFEDMKAQEYQPEASIEPFIEIQRFESWAWCLKIEIKGSPRFRGAQMSNSLNHDQFQSAIELLYMLRQELQSMQLQKTKTRLRVWMPIRHINTRLLNLLPHHLQKRAMEYVEVRVLDTKDLETLQGLQHALPLGHLPMLATVKRLSLLEEPSEQLAGTSMRMLVQPVVGSGRLGHHLIGTLQLSESGPAFPVLIELKCYEDALLRGRLVSRLEGIAKLSSSIPEPQRLRVLHCRGYYHDDTRSAFALVYDYPLLTTSGRHETTACTASSLRQILEAQLRAQQPTLRERFKLAYDVAYAINMFQKVGWFHKGISSACVAFFSDKEEWFEGSSLEPYIIGFRHSRPREPTAFTEGPPSTDPDERCYQHPEYLQKNVLYSSKHEFYSLGIVLLEIGLWKPLRKMGKIDSALPAESIRLRLIESVIPRLGQSMGVVYRDVVAALIGNTDDTEDLNQEGTENKTLAWFNGKILNCLYQLSSLAL